MEALMLWVTWRGSQDIDTHFITQQTLIPEYITGVFSAATAQEIKSCEFLLNNKFKKQNNTCMFKVVYLSHTTEI